MATLVPPAQLVRRNETHMSKKKVVEIPEEIVISREEAIEKGIDVEEVEATAEISDAEAVIVPKGPKSDRQIRWEKYVEAYMLDNPVKGAAKKANGEFDTIPNSFK